MFQKVLALGIVIILSGVAIQGTDVSLSPVKETTEGFTGVSWDNVMPVRKATFVGFDENSVVDDYAFLAAVPTAVFQHDNTLYSYPLLYYEDRVISNQKELPLDAGESLHYFMEDWTNYCGNLEIELINAPQATHWDASYQFINGTDPFDVARTLAVNHWMNSDVAVVAPIMDPPIAATITGDTTITLDSATSTSFSLMIAEPDGIGGVYESFVIEEPYVYVDVNVDWHPLLRGNDIDLQLFDNALGMVDASSEWNALSGTHEGVSSYVFNHGLWEAGLTFMPTEKIGVLGDIAAANKYQAGRQYEAIIDLYSGIHVDLPPIPFLAKDMAIEISTTPNISFGALLLSPAGIAYETVRGQGQVSLTYDEIAGGTYSLCLFPQEDADTTQFHVSYTWQEISSNTVDSFAYAAQGAILASLFNAPLLYTEKDTLPQATQDALEHLNVTTVYAIQTEETIREQLGDNITTHMITLEETYNMIYQETESQDIVFTSASPWSYWLAEDLQPAGEKDNAFYVGPAAYAAAHHGCPLLIVEEHLALSQASSWVTDLWKRESRSRETPPVGNMYLMATQVYDFLATQGYDWEGNEDILTVAGQFDMGIAWDRAFVGKANPGRILGTPVDAAQWISRNIFYPALVFENPGMNTESIELINGSESRRDPLGRLHVNKESAEEDFTYPVLQTWVSYCHDFNKDASLYWGLPYTCRDGITPYITPSPDPIDDGVTDKEGSYWPDMSTPDVVPFYLSKLGYDNVFTTNFSTTMENLNRGVIMWFEGMHAAQVYTGIVGFWDPDADWTSIFYSLQDIPIIGKILESKKINTEPNPWRGYEFGPWRQGLFRWRIPFIGYDTQLFQTGSTADPDVVVMGKMVGWDWRSAPHGDGVVITILQQVSTETKTGYDIDAALENLHSCAVNGGPSCLIAATYLHLALVRHGTVLQVIDPWTTSWYCHFAVEMFARYLAKGDTAGEAYAKGMSHVGIEYLTGKWWWDTGENVCYYGDPCLRVWSPVFSWEKPVAVDPGFAGTHVV